MSSLNFDFEALVSAGHVEIQIRESLLSISDPLTA